MKPTPLSLILLPNLGFVNWIIKAAYFDHFIHICSFVIICLPCCYFNPQISFSYPSALLLKLRSAFLPMIAKNDGLQQQQLKDADSLQVSYFSMVITKSQYYLKVSSSASYVHQLDHWESFVLSIDVTCCYRLLHLRKMRDLEWNYRKKFSHLDQFPYCIYLRNFPISLRQQLTQLMSLASSKTMRIWGTCGYARLFHQWSSSLLIQSVSFQLGLAQHCWVEMLN